MNREDFDKLFSDDDYCNFNIKGDSAFRGLVIISKYIDTSKKRVVDGAEHDVVYGPDVHEIIEAGISEEDAIKLKEENWFIDSECGSLAHFV